MGFGGVLKRKVSYKIQMPWEEKEGTKLQSKAFKKHIKEILLLVLLENQEINQWQYEESLKRLKKEA